MLSEVGYVVLLLPGALVDSDEEAQEYDEWGDDLEPMLAGVGSLPPRARGSLCVSPSMIQEVSRR